MNINEKESFGFKEELKEKLLGTVGISAAIGGLTLMTTSRNNVAELAVGVAAIAAGLGILKITDSLIESKLQAQGK